VSFAGSVNKRTFLSDETGSRRFPVVAIGGNIDLKALGSIDIDRLWAQAKALYEAGYQYWWDAEDNERLAKWNGQFETTTYADDLVFKWCKPVDDEQKRPRMSATEILQAISRKEFDVDKNIVTVIPQLVKDMGRALVRAGYKARGQRHQGHMKNGYAVEILAEPRKAFASHQDVKAEDLF
jgi:predicted P-loop ATPase